MSSELALTVIVFILLLVFWAMMRFTFSLIDRAHTRLREEARDSGSNPVGRKAGW